MISLVSSTIDNTDIDRLIDWLKTYPRLTKGNITLELEQKWSKWLGTNHSLFCNSGSSANLLMLYALKCSDRLKNQKVVVPGLSWATDLAPVIQLGMSPLLCDCNLETLSVDLEHLEKIFKRHAPSVFLLVSILGFSPPMDKIVKLCERYDVILLEDNCESTGTMFKKKKLGTFGLMSSFSTYFGHHISTIEGGFVSTNDKEMNDILMSIRSHGWGRDWDKATQQKYKSAYQVSDFNSLYTFFYPGFNFRSTDLQAYIGLTQIDKLPYICKRRNDNYNLYRSKLKTEWKPLPITGTFTSNFAYPIIHPNREAIVSELTKCDVEIRPLVCGSMATQPFYTDFYNKVTLPNCNIVDTQGIYVPNHVGITDKDITIICDAVNKCL